MHFCYKVYSLIDDCDHYILYTCIIFTELDKYIKSIELCCIVNGC